MAGTSLQLDGKGQYLGQADPPAKTTPSIYNQGVYNKGIYNLNSSLNLNIGNVWTLGFWLKPKSTKEHTVIFHAQGQGDKNEIKISTTPLSVGTTARNTSASELRVFIKDFEGTTIKHLGWGGWGQTDTWIHTFVLWDGGNLNAYKDAVIMVSGSVFINTSGTMAGSPARRLSYGSTREGTLATYSGTLGHFGMWNEILDIEELRTVVSGGFEIDLTTVSGSYISGANLQHYWKPGDDPANIGKDFTTSGTPLPFTKQQDVDSTNITLDQP